MTTIAYRDGVLAADSKAYGGRYCASPGEKVKLHRITDGRCAGWIVGISTNNVGGDAMILDWINRGAPLPTTSDTKPDQFIVLAVDPGGSLHLANDNYAFSGPIKADRYAVGSGADFALGAMAMGATAEQAIEVASSLDPHTGGTVTALRISAE